MKVIIRISLLAFLICFSMVLRAQLPHIVKDYNNCTEGLQNDKGEWIVQPIYESIAPFAWNHSIVRRGGLYGVIDAKGKEVISAEWSDAKAVAFSYGTPMSGLYEMIGKNDTCALIDTNGRRVLTTLFPFSPYFIDSVSFGTQGNQVKFVHLDGSVYTAPTGTQATLMFLMHDRYEYTIDSFTLGYNNMHIQHQFHGVLDSRGKVIVPAMYDHVQCEIEGTHPVIIVYKDPVFCGFYTLDGRKLWDCVFQVGSLSYKSYFNPMSPGYAVAYYKNKYGVLGWNGDTLVPFVFSEQPSVLLVSSENGTDTAWLIHEQNKYGVYNEKQGWLLDTVYSLISPVQSYNSCKGNITTWFVCCVQNKYGCIGPEKDTLVPFVYDRYIVTQEGMLFVNDTSCLLFEMDNSEGGVGTSTKRHDKLSHEVVSSPYNYPLDDIYQGVAHGDTVFEDNDAWNEYYLYRHPELQWQKKNKWLSHDPYPYLWLQPFDPQPIQLRIDTIPGNDKCTVLAVVHTRNLNDYYYEDDYNPDPTYTYEQPFAILWRDQSDQQHISLPQQGIDEKLMTFGNDYTTQGLMTYGGHVLFLPGAYAHIERRGYGFLAIDTNYKVVFLDSLGNEVARTGAQNGTGYNDSLTWLVTRDSVHFMRDGSPFTVLTWNYRLYNTYTLSYASDTSFHFIETFAPSERPTVVQTKTGAGVIDPFSFKIYVAPHYARVINLESSYRYYAVQSCSGRVGIVDSNNVLVVDTVYDNLIQLVGQRYYNVNNTWQPLAITPLVFLLSTDSNAAIFDSQKGLYPVDSTYSEVVHKVIEGTQQLDASRDSRNYSTRYDCPTCKAIIRPEQRDSLLPWQNILLYHMMFNQSDRFQPFQQYPYPNYCKCSEDDYNSYRYNQRGYDYFAFHPIVITATTDSLLSFKILPQYEGNDWQGFFTPKTFLLTANGPQEARLDSLFNGDAWRNVITDSLLSYLGQHKNIDADCSRPGYMVQSMNDRFLVQADGLHLYPEWHRETNGTYITTMTEVIIPWEGLNPYLRSDVKGKLPR